MVTEALARVSPYPRVLGFLRLLRRIQRLLLVLVPRCPGLRRLLGGCGGSGFVFWSVKVGGRGGGEVCAVSGSPYGVPELYDFRCLLGLSLLVRSCSFFFYTVLPLASRCCSAAPVWRIAGVHPWRSECITRDFCVTIILSFGSFVVTCGSPGMPCLWM